MPKSPKREAVAVERLVLPEATDSDQVVEQKRPQIRPLTFRDYPGQAQVKNNLEVYVKAARKLARTLDHVILHGPPGLGKTTLAHIVAAELDVPLITTSGPAVDKPADLAGILAGIEAGTILFIDEIHRLPIKVEEMLYSAMEDFCLDVLVGQGPTARTVRMPLPSFTLVGATTRLSLVSKPMLGRFGIQEKLVYYQPAELVEILQRSAAILDIPLEVQGAEEIARRSRGTPRLANRLLKRVWDFAVVAGQPAIDQGLAARILEDQGIDGQGLDRTDKEILETIASHYSGGPVGIDALASSLHHDRGTIEDVYEPFLVHQGFLARGPRGRFLTDKGRRHTNFLGENRKSLFEE